VFYVMPAVLYFAWRLSYYGELFPLPFYKKIGDAHLAGVPNVAAFLWVLLPLLPLILIGVIAGGRRLLPLSAMALVLVTYALVPLHVMAYANRYEYAAVPLVAVLAGVGTTALARVALHRIPVPRRVVLLICTLVVFAVWIVGTQPDHNLTGTYAPGLQRAHVAIGRNLARMPGSGRVLAITDAGAIPYLTGWKTLDLFSLNDRHIATTGDHRPDYVFSWHPDVIVLISANREMFHARADINPYENAVYRGAVQRGYVRADVRRFEDAYYLWVLRAPAPH
jgi:hypothetical protein